MYTQTIKVLPSSYQPQNAVSQKHQYNRSQISIISNPINKTRLSQSIKKSIANQHQQHQHIGKVEGEESQLTKMVRNKIKQLRKIAICQICDCKFRRTQLYMCQCQHKYNFCHHCLYSYAIYKIKQFEQIYCPSQNCGITLDANSKFFKNIPINLQNIYHKIHRFTIAAKDTSVIKLCPNQCQGLLRIKPQNQGLVCDTCKKQYCDKCYLAKHEGDCQDYELIYFQNHLHYRQCRRCKMIVQRNKGCNHMTCHCNYEFCYVCGEKWTAYHVKLHQQNNNQDPHQHHRMRSHSFMLQIVEYCMCVECQQGICLHFWNSYFGCLMKLIFKLVLLLVQGLCLLIQLMLRDIPFLVWMLTCTVVIGMFFTSIKVICESECLHGLLLMVFFPVAMLIGVYRSCEQVFFPALQQFYGGAITPISNGFNDIISY